MTQIPDWLNHVGPGWHALLGQLHADIIALDPEYEVAQVKEKFGGLRAYLKSQNQAVYTLAHEAELQSMEICEDCGQPGHIRNRLGRTWLQCLCDACVLSTPKEH